MILTPSSRRRTIRARSLSKSESAREHDKGIVSRHFPPRSAQTGSPAIRPCKSSRALSSAAFASVQWATTLGRLLHDRRPVAHETPNNQRPYIAVERGKTRLGGTGENGPWRGLAKAAFASLGGQAQDHNVDLMLNRPDPVIAPCVHRQSQVPDVKLGDLLVRIHLRQPIHCRARRSRCLPPQQMP